MLTWLQIGNALYRNVVINHDLLLFIPDEYIFEGILSKVIIIENNSSECKDYGADLVGKNDENNLHHAIKAASINKSEILSDCIYTNINKSRQNPYLKLIFAIYNLSDDNAMEDYKNNPRPVISYNLHNDGKPLND